MATEFRSSCCAASDKMGGKQKDDDAIAPALETLIALWLVRSAPFSFGNGTRQMSVQLVTVLDRVGILGS